MKKRSIIFYKLILSVVLFFVTLEVSLRLFYPYMPISVANELANKYKVSFQGIYNWDHKYKIKTMKPNYNADMFSSGYRWNHQTDSLGFRNQSVDGADIILIGDSIIYGHGVEEESTVASVLSDISKLEVYNMGQQGVGPYEEYIHINKHLRALSPRKLFMFFLHNDLYDISRRLNEEEMNNFIVSNSFDDLHKYIFNRRENRFKYSILDKLGKDLFSIRCLFIVTNSIFKEKKSLYDVPKISTANIFPLSQLQQRVSKKIEPIIPVVSTKNKQISLPMELTKNALKKIQELCDELNIQFVFFYIHLNHKYDDQFERELFQFCKQYNIKFESLKDLLKQNKDPIFLKNDGHFNHAGSTLLAKHLYRNYIQ